jgi:hypothetical protein
LHLNWEVALYSNVWIPFNSGWADRRIIPMRTELGLGFDPEGYMIMWWCPVCYDCGYISNWQGSMWDLGNAGEVH